MKGQVVSALKGINALKFPKYEAQLTTSHLQIKIYRLKANYSISSMLSPSLLGVVCTNSSPPLGYTHLNSINKISTRTIRPNQPIKIINLHLYQRQTTHLFHAILHPFLHITRTSTATPTPNQPRSTFTKPHGGLQLANSQQSRRSYLPKRPQ